MVDKFAFDDTFFAAWIGCHNVIFADFDFAKKFLVQRERNRDVSHSEPIFFVYMLIKFYILE